MGRNFCMRIRSAFGIVDLQSAHKPFGFGLGKGACRSLGWESLLRRVWVTSRMEGERLQVTSEDNQKRGGRTVVILVMVALK